MIERLRRIGKVKTTFIVAFIAFVFAYYYFIKRKEKLHSRKVEIQGALRQEQIQINKESSSAKLATEDVPSGEQVVLKNELVSSEIEKPGMAAVTPSIATDITKRIQFKDTTKTDQITDTAKKIQVESSNDYDDLFTMENIALELPVRSAVHALNMKLLRDMLLKKLTAKLGKHVAKK
ncbi:hypothetical protein DINM_005284 [Dirofilaria immitis]|nr:hypothetical protein [Dirofilaria immitis]